MFLLAFTLVLGLAFGPQVALGNFKFSLSPVIQCEPVNITFSGSGADNHSVPTTFTIFPLQDNAKPIPISIPNGATNTTGIQLNFIPLEAGQRFIASLDDSPLVLNGTLSDVTLVQNSTNGPNIGGCFDTTPVSFYTVDENLSQCEDFTVQYSTSVAPNITAFYPPIGIVAPVFPNTSSPSNGPGIAAYTMDGFREASVMLLLDDGEGNRQTTKLVTISGDSSSSKSCFDVFKNSTSASSSGGSKSKHNKSAQGKLSQVAIVGISIGSAIIGLLAIFLLIYMLVMRRRNRRVSNMSDFDPKLLNQKWPPDLEEKKIESWHAPTLNQTSPSSLTPQVTPQGFVRDPIYTKQYASSIVSEARTSISSWNQFVPKDQRGDPRARSNSIGSSRLSMGTVEVQDILQMATVHRARSTATTNAQEPQPSTAGTAMTTFDVAKPAMARLVPNRRNDRGIGNAPAMPNPFDASRNSTDAAVAGVPAQYSSYMSFDDGEDEIPQSEDPGAYPIPSFKTSDLRRDTSDSWVVR